MSPVQKGVLARDSLFIKLPRDLRVAIVDRPSPKSDAQAIEQLEARSLGKDLAHLNNVSNRKGQEDLLVEARARLRCRSSGCIKLHQVTLEPSESFVFV